MPLLQWPVTPSQIRMDCAFRHELNQILAPAGCLCQALCHNDKDVNMNTIATATLCPPKA